MAGVCPHQADELNGVVLHSCAPGSDLQDGQIVEDPEGFFFIDWHLENTTATVYQVVLHFSWHDVLWERVIFLQEGEDLAGDSLLQVPADAPLNSPDEVVMEIASVTPAVDVSETARDIKELDGVILAGCFLGVGSVGGEIEAQHGESVIVEYRLDNTTNEAVEVFLEFTWDGWAWYDRHGLLAGEIVDTNSLLEIHEQLPTGVSDTIEVDLIDVRPI